MSANHDEIQLYDELKGFLLSDRFDLRFAATDAVLQQILHGCSGTKSDTTTTTTTNGTTNAIVPFEKSNGQGNINRNNTNNDNDATKSSDSYRNENLEKIVQFGIVPILAKNSSYSVEDDNDDDTDAGTSSDNHHVQGLVLSVNSLKALVHLSSNGYYANQVIHELITQSGGMNRMIEIVLSSPPTLVQPESSSSIMNTPISPISNSITPPPPPSVTETLWRQRVNYAMSLLANMTRLEEGAVEMTGLTMDDTTAIHQPLTEKLPPKPSLELIYSRYMNSTFIRTTTTTATTTALGTRNDVIDKTNTSGSSSSTVPSSALQMHMTNNDDVDPTITKSDDATLDSNYNDPYQHFSAVLMNITQVEQGRQFVLKIHRSGGKKKEHNNQNDDNVPKTTAITSIDQNVAKEDEEEKEWTILQSLLSQLRSTNPIRRRGIAGMIRNCVLDRDSAWWFINVVQITKHLLYPLAGPEELDFDEKQGLEPELWLEGPDKVRETDVYTRLYLVESILLLLGSGRHAREQLRIQRVYVILKVADMVETNEEITELIYECVNYLRADEPGTYEGSSDQSVKDAYNTNLLQPHLQPKASAIVGERRINIDDNDDLDEID